MKAKQKLEDYRVTVQLQIVEIEVKATSKTDAKKKALSRLSRKNPVKLIHTGYPSNRKEIYIDKL